MTVMVGAAGLWLLVWDLQIGRLWHAVNSDQLLECEVRANTAVGFPFFLVVKKLSVSAVLSSLL